MDILHLTSIVRDAAELMKTDNFTVKQKGGCENIVTSADLSVQSYLIERLKEAMPHSGFICEEDDIADVKHRDLWIIDPIDGTANFSRGIDQCAIAVGLCREGVMQLAAVYLPRTAQMFSAVRGEGAYVNGNRIHVSDRVFTDSIMCTALPVYYKEYTDLCSRVITETFRRCNDIRRFGAAAPELCYLAMGRVELYFEYLLSPWDFAAASLIVEEAGGCLSTPDGAPLDYTRPSGVVAANSAASLSQLLEIIASAKAVYQL